MHRDRTHRDNGGERGEHTGTTRTPDTAHRVRGFFERASERVRAAARDLSQRARGERHRDIGPPMPRGEYDYRDRGYDEGARDSGREWRMREHDEWRGDERGLRANLGGGYDMRNERGTVRDYMHHWGNDRERGYGGHGGSQYMRGEERPERGRDRDENRWETRWERYRGRRW